MKQRVTQVLKDGGLSTGRDFCWVDNYGIEEIHVQGDIHDRDARAIQIAEELYQNKIPFQIHGGHRFRLRNHHG